MNVSADSPFIKMSASCSTNWMEAVRALDSLMKEVIFDGYVF